MSARLAIVFCVHHKPWLMMSSLLTLLAQEQREADLFFVYNQGDGVLDRPSYVEYADLAARAGVNGQLSPFDERVRQVCQLRETPFTELTYDNDHALDSGVWYKFIREGRWRDYDHVLFAGEGLLFAHPRVLSAAVSLATRRNIGFIASGHEKRRVPRDTMIRSYRRGQDPTPMDAFHDRMIEQTFGVFCRDPEFRAIYDRWDSSFPVQTEHHVPGVSAGDVRSRRWRGSVQRRWGTRYLQPDVGGLGGVMREWPDAWDRWRSSEALLAPLRSVPADPDALAYEAGGYGVTRPAGAAEIDTEQGVTFHRVDAPEWFGCTVIHLLSRSLLERFAERLERYALYEALDLPFAGSALEVAWGFLPAWLGTEKWFTNGFHRVRKHFATYRREDYPPEMAGYINRYLRGRLVVDWDGDLLKLRDWRPGLGDLRRILPDMYF